MFAYIILIFRIMPTIFHLCSFFFSDMKMIKIFNIHDFHDINLKTNVNEFSLPNLAQCLTVIYQILLPDKIIYVKIMIRTSSRYFLKNLDFKFAVLVFVSILISWSSVSTKIIATFSVIILSLSS